MLKSIYYLIFYIVKNIICFNKIKLNCCFFVLNYGKIKKMSLKKIIQELNIYEQCRRYNISLWQCPSFLFLLMGLIIIASSILTYFIGSHYINNPYLVALLVLILTSILLVIAFLINKSFEKLVEVAKMKTEFVNIISHQLQAPLSNLRWSVELLTSKRLGEIDEKQLEYFKIIKENADRMKDLIADLLIVSRIETGTLTLNKKEINLENLTSQIIKELEPLIKASNAKINLNIQKDLPPLFTDEFQLKTVIENLLENAVNYLKNKGEIEILIKKKGNYIYFEIKDNGIGIPKNDQRYIFQKFFRSSNVLTHQPEGTGLGLYICKAIIEKLKGKIGFYSQENKGSTFWFTLPITH
mgnify:CR=1 FL=1